MLKKLIEVVLNILFWILTTWFFLTIFSIETKTIQVINGVKKSTIFYSRSLLIQIIGLAFFSALMLYTSLWVLLKAKVNQQKKGLLLRVLIIPISALLLFLIFQRIDFIPTKPILPLSVVFGIFCFYYIVSFAYCTGKLWQLTESRNKQLELEKKEAELSLLRSQLHPHFLFNVLNNLLAMIDQKSDSMAADAIQRLSGLLRYVVYEVNSKKVPVRKEIDFIQDYIALHLLRFEKNEINLTVNIEGQYDHQLCEPGLFIPFVENAFKYGVEPEHESVINISFNIVSPHVIIFTCENPLLDIRENIRGSGSGIRSVLKRLELIYTGQYSYEYREVNDKYMVRLEIKTNENNNR